MRAIVISVGNELTLGQTIDTNAAWLAQRLAEVGVTTPLHLTVADDQEALEREIRRASEWADVVLVSGGLGPTEDDLTRHALADAMGVDLQLREEYIERIRGFFTKRRLDMPDTNVIQAHFPVGSTPIDNTCGTAPGIRAAIGDCLAFAMPGVPREMKVMFERDVLPQLTPKSGSGVILATTLWCYGAGESDIGEKIHDLMQRGQNPTVGTTAQQTIIGVRIHAHGQTHDQAAQLRDNTANEVLKRLGQLVFGTDDDTLASAVAKLLIEKKQTVATAESCTGGLIAKSLTDIPGSTAYFLDGVVTYSNEAKTRLLGIPSELIAKHGAVSPEVAHVMATNCRERSGSDLAISVTGIAGPTGQTPDKPVGLVYIGLADHSDCNVTRHQMGDYLTREEIRDRARKLALNRLRLKLLAQ